MVIKSKQSNMHNKKIEVNLLKEIVKEDNSIPLPNIPDTPRILLPPPEHSLIRSNFQIFSEDILQSFNNPCDSTVTQEGKIHEDLDDAIKKQTMIGLKRKDYDDRPNVVLSKKKMRLSANSDERSHKFGVSSGQGFNTNKIAYNQQSANVNNNFSRVRKQSVEKIDFDINENDDESMSNYNYNNAFIMNNENNSEIEDYNYEMNF
jgi:hypothetical protein